ncbi:contactin-associated protein-like 5 [Sigmodon hispidus]
MEPASENCHPCKLSPQGSRPHSGLTHQQTNVGCSDSALTQPHISLKPHQAEERAPGHYTHTHSKIKWTRQSPKSYAATCSWHCQQKKKKKKEKKEKENTHERCQCNSNKGRSLDKTVVQGKKTNRRCASIPLPPLTETLGLDPEVDRANILGFIGCLSSIQYNHRALLKAALRHADIAPVTVQGTLKESNCGSMVDYNINAVTTVHSSSGVIAVVTFITFCVIGIMTYFLYQHKQSQHTSQKKEKDYPENLDTYFRNDIDLQNTAISQGRPDL